MGILQFRAKVEEPKDPLVDVLVTLLRQMPTAVIIVDVTKATIEFANNGTIDLMRTLKISLADQPARVVGLPLVALHSDLSSLGAKLRDPSQMPLFGRLSFGAETADYMISPIDTARHPNLVNMTWWHSTNQGKVADQFERDVGASGAKVVRLTTTFGQKSRQLAERVEQAEAETVAVGEDARQLTASIAEIAERVEAARRAGDQATAEADRSNARMQSLATRAEEIGSIVVTIEQIASQTNLLALNATIEAARAGDVGRGFAVVAQEVKTLAAQTAQATQDIAAKIQAIQQESLAAVDAIRSIGTNIDDTKKVMSGITQAVERQASLTHEVSIRVGKACGMARENRAAASHLLSEANEVEKQAGDFNSILEGFIEQLRKL